MIRYRTSILYHWNKAGIARHQARAMFARGWENAARAYIEDFRYHLNQCKQFRALEPRGGW